MSPRHRWLALISRSLRKRVEGFAWTLKKKSQGQANLTSDVRSPVDFICSYAPVFRRKHQVRPRTKNVVGKHHLIARRNQWCREVGAKRLPERGRMAPPGSRRNIELMLRAP